MTRTSLENEALRLAEANAREVITLRLECENLRSEVKRERDLREYAERRIAEWQQIAFNQAALQR